MKQLVISTVGGTREVMYDDDAQADAAYATLSAAVGRFANDDKSVSIPYLGGEITVSLGLNGLVFVSIMVMDERELLLVVEMRRYRKRIKEACDAV